MQGLPGISIPIEPLCAALAVNSSTWVEATSLAQGKGIRVDSAPQLQFHIDYHPHAHWVTNPDTTYLEVQLLFSRTPSDDAVSWRTYCEERDLGDGSNDFVIKTWKIYTNGTANADLSPTWARPLTAKRVSFQFMEFGTDTRNGTVDAWIASQPI